MSKTNYQIKERERRIATTLSFIRARPDGVAIKDAAYLISQEQSMRAATTKKIDEYLIDLEKTGFIYLTSEGIIKVTLKTSKRFGEWMKNGG